MTHSFLSVYWKQFYYDEHFASFFPNNLNKTKLVWQAGTKKMGLPQKQRAITHCTFYNLFLANTLTTFGLENMLLTFPLILRSSGRPGLLQFYHLFLHLSGDAGLHLAGGPGDQKQDFLRDLPDVLQEKQSGNQSGLRWHVAKRKQREPGRWGEGHGLLKRNTTLGLHLHKVYTRRGTVAHRESHNLALT